jgi:putative glutamine amidotransferase
MNEWHGKTIHISFRSRLVARTGLIRDSALARQPGGKMAKMRLITTCCTHRSLSLTFRSARPFARSASIGHDPPVMVGQARLFNPARNRLNSQAGAAADSGTGRSFVAAMSRRGGPRCGRSGLEIGNPGVPAAVTERHWMMTKPVIGVIGNRHIVENRFAVQMAGERNLAAVVEVVHGLPLIFAGSPVVTDIPALLDAVDGVILTGARANVHPRLFHTEPSPKYEPYDENRDALALPLIEACVERAVPVFGICRGLQEMNVTFGGSLHPEIRELPGHMNHRMPRLENGEIHPDPAVVFADRHNVRLMPGGAFARIFGRDTIRVNSLHGQGILDPGKRIVVEGVAEDETVEAIRIKDAPGFALGVQWHAEYDPQTNPVNRALFEAFGEAVRGHQRQA